MPTTPATQNTPDAVNNASNTSTVTPAIPNKAPSAPTATPPTAPVSIIGTGKASDTLQNTMIPTMQTASQNLAAQNALVAAKNAGPQLDSNGKPFTFGTTPSQTPNSGNGGVNNGSSQNSSQGSQTPPEQTPGTPEHTLLNTPEAGNQYVYDPQGNRLEVPIGNVPVGMTTTPPPAPPTVAGEVTQSNGTTIKQLSDGTFGSYDASGNYQGTASPQQYQDAQTANTLSQNIANLANGTMPLSVAEQAQVNAVQNSFASLIAEQQKANANLTGGVTVAENLYGMGNSISGLGEIKSSIDSGLAKIADLNSQMASAVAKMEEGFKTDDMTMFKDAYDVLTASQKDRQTALDKIKADTDAAAKSARDYNLQLQNQKDAEAKNTFDQTMAQANLSLSQKKDTFDEYIQQANLTETQKKDASDAWYKAQDIALRRQAQNPYQNGNIQPVQVNASGAPLASSQKAFLAQLPPSVATMIQGLANYSINPADYATRLAKGAPGMTRADAVALAKQYDPTYDDSQWQSRQKLQNNFTSGQYSQNITSLNTAAAHISDLVKAFGDLNNKSGLMSIFNKPENSLLSVFGSGRINSADTNIKAAVDEMATAFKGSGATTQEIEDWKNSINRNASKDQSTAFINKAIQLLGDRLNNLDETYSQGMGKPSTNGFLHDSVAAQLVDLQNKGFDVNIPALQENASVKLANAAKDSATANMISQIRQIAPNATPDEILSQLGIQ